MTRTTILLAVLTSTLTISTGTAQAFAKGSATRTCGSTIVKLGPDAEGSAYKIRATRVSCRRARIVARACVRNAVVGWGIFGEPQDDLPADHPEYAHFRTGLHRGDARITFEVVGGGGCYPWYAEE